MKRQTSQQLVSRRREVVSLTHKGWTQAAIASHLKIPQGTKNGQKFRLREKGVQNSRTNTRGDQIVEVAIEAPVVHDERTKELLREYAKLHPEDPREQIWAGSERRPD